ncbi:MAG TPA: prolyl oligopeptidase family serine peptidase [Bryobacteraceae bacterium]|nr:prolyl oligopeptidase family serine peptidase [Bryobacteraceae bacterium]
MLRRIALALICILPLGAAKRPLTHADYDGWRHIQNQQLSNDGHFLAYALFPQEGDGEVVVRNLITGKEIHQPIGELPPPPPASYANPQTEEAPPPPPGIAVKFSEDSRTLVVSSFGSHAEIEKAKREKRKPEDMPRGDLIIVDLISSKVFRAPRVRNFQLPVKGNGFVAYWQAPEKIAAETPVANKPAESSSPEASSKARRIETGDLVLRNLNSGEERKFTDVSEYALTKDGKTLVYAVYSRKGDTNGVYAVKTSVTGDPQALLTGKGKYEKLAWDEGQTRLAFVSDRDDAGARQSRFKLYGWDGESTGATELASSNSPGFPSDWVISDKATLTFSKKGDRVFFGTAPRPHAEMVRDNTPPDERVSVDLWSWKDDYIQPMQKVRAAVERDRSYRAAYDFNSKQFTQLADLSMNEIAPSDDGRYAMGGDDRAYRRMQEFDERYEDAYIVDTANGKRTLVLKKHPGRLTWSPDSKYAIYYNGKDWVTVSVPGGSVTNLTKSLNVSFGREDYDSPGNPTAYGTGGWTKDGQYVLLYDRFDIWRCKPSGGCDDLTQGTGRARRIAFRIVKYDRDDPADRSIDSTKPLLLRAENDETYDSGFYRTTIDAAEAPSKLVMAAKNFTLPAKARDADVYVLAGSTFRECPDLLITDGTFRELRKVSDANPQQAGVLWGTAELIHFKSADGVSLKGTLYKPENFDPQKKYPLLVYIYERLSQGVHNYVEPRPMHTINVSYYVSNGYLVLEPDIAYKIGFPGQSALNCVLPAIQEVVDRGFVNEKAIGIQGHSWGGYQIAYMVTRTNRFRAAAAGAPVADMISAYDGIRWGPGIPRQFQYERTQSRIGGSIWEYPLRYIENSPIFAADRVNTPLLMIHNDADDAVPWYQGIEYYLALRRLGKEVYMFTYNGEPHGLRRRPDQKDYAMRLQQFFDYYLKGAPEPDWMEHGIPYIEKQGAVSADSQ